MSKFSVKLYEDEMIMLNDLIKKYNYKSKADAVRGCIKNAYNIESTFDKLSDIDNKLNRLLYRENITKKLVEQFYANMELKKDQDVKTEEGLVRFYENNNFYINKIMD